MADNPFDYPPPQSNQNMSGNPFETGTGPPDYPQQYEASAFVQPVATPVTYNANVAAGIPENNSYPFFGTAPLPVYDQPGPAYTPYQNGHQSPPLYYNYPQQQQPMPAYSTAVVTSQQPSNPYALNDYSGGVVPVTQQNNPWGIPVSTGGTDFDPFAPPAAQPPPALDYSQAMVPAAPRHMEPYNGASQIVDDNPFDLVMESKAAPESEPESQKPAAQIKPTRSFSEEPQGQQNYTRPPSLSYDHGSNHENRMVVHEPPEDRMIVSPAAKFRQELARQAPPGSSPLPKAELVRKRGFVLSRISFRSIVMKKWKQSFWVQYGPHTMLWFRSQSDFDDWLNNPYHTQTQRNFLIKLAVNFVHDLYKPSVRGYQVTQCRVKAYGRKMVRQFKLERWMDYGPTIAAAFGSYNPKEVDDLREALVECMRNTPLSGGIRATGAVREGRSHEEEHNDDDDDDDDPQHQRGYANSIDEPPRGEQDAPDTAESVAEEADLLDVENWDDVPLSAPPQDQPSVAHSHHSHESLPYQQDQPSAVYSHHSQQSVSSAPPLHRYSAPSSPYGNGAGQTIQPSQGPPSNYAVVPSVNPSLAYPGAPPLPLYQQQQQQQQAPSMPGYQQQQQQTYQQPMPVYQQQLPSQQQQQAMPIPPSQQQLPAPMPTYSLQHPPAPMPATQHPVHAPVQQQYQDPWAVPTNPQQQYEAPLSAQPPQYAQYPQSQQQHF